MLDFFRHTWNRIFGTYNKLAKRLSVGLVLVDQNSINWNTTFTIGSKIFVQKWYCIDNSTQNLKEKNWQSKSSKLKWSAFSENQIIKTMSFDISELSDCLDKNIINATISFIVEKEGVFLSIF